MVWKILRCITIINKMVSFCIIFVRRRRFLSLVACFLLPSTVSFESSILYLFRFKLFEIIIYQNITKIIFINLIFGQNQVTGPSKMD